jgi:hypothetical protein
LYITFIGLEEENILWVFTPFLMYDSFIGNSIRINWGLRKKLKSGHASGPKFVMKSSSWLYSISEIGLTLRNHVLFIGARMT